MARRLHEIVADLERTSCTRDQDDISEETEELLEELAEVFKHAVSRSSLSPRELLAFKNIFSNELLKGYL